MSPSVATDPTAQQREMLKLYESGYPYTLIGKRFHYTPSGIAKQLKPYLTPEIVALHQKNYREKLFSRKAPLSETLAMRRLYLKGFDYVEIGERYNLGKNSVRTRVKDLLTDSQRKRARERQKQRRIRRQQATVRRLKPQVAKLIKDGSNGQEVMQALGIKHNLLYEVTATLNTDTKLRMKSRAGSTGATQYSKADKLAALREAAALSDGHLSIKRFTQLRPDHPHWPCAATYLRTKRWNQWLKAAGVAAKHPVRGSGKSRYSEKDCREATRRVALVLKRVFSAEEFDAHRLSTDPQARTLINRFGGGKWLPALEYLMPNLFTVNPLQD
jgi:hypothetical protein